MLCLQMYANASRLTFTEVQDEDDMADINISFKFGDHGDGANFDGPGGALAHAFLPPQGELHFDASESWSVQHWYGKYWDHSLCENGIDARNIS